MAADTDKKADAKAVVKRTTNFRPLVEEKVRLTAARIQTLEADDYTSAEFSATKAKTCPKCGNRLARNETSCGFCHNEQKRKQKQTGAIIGVTIAAIIVGALIVLTVTGRGPSRKPFAAASASAAAPPAIPKDGTWLTQPDATVNLPKSSENLRARNFYVSRERGSDFVVVAGDIENISAHNHRNVKVKIDLLDLNGKTVATLDDVITQLTARRTWHIATRTNAPTAVNARVSKLTEAP